MNEQSAFKIESNDLAIHQIFKDFYTVPDFQREYVWERDHVDKLLQDVLDEFYDEDNQQINGPEYFLGSIVACRDPEGIFQLIDGQQRMTTIYLVLCAARDAMVDAGERPTRVLESQITDAYSDATTGDDIERHRLTLQYEDSGDVLEQLAKTNPNVDGILQTTESVRKILSAYRCIHEFLLINFKNDSSAIKLFLLAFTRRIKLIRILTPTITNALKVFETIK